jgi:predicted ATPase
MLAASRWRCSSTVSVVSHAPRLNAALEEQRGCHPIPLEKVRGETRIAGAERLDRPGWHWPAR